MFTALLVIVATLVTQAAPAGVNQQTDTLTVVGATQPAQIPEWLVWEYSFTLLKQWQGKDSGFTHDLRESLSPGEFELLEKEALAHAAREARRESPRRTADGEVPEHSDGGSRNACEGERRSVRDRSRVPPRDPRRA